MRSIYLALGVMTVSTISLADGGTSSGGGNSITNRNNPWFIENTPTVRYCVELDEANFGLKLSVVEKTIVEVLDYWKNSFKTSENDNYEEGELQPYGQLRVATQDFIKEDCAEETDLRFQLGTLSAEQIAEMGDPKEFIGLAFRTSYDSQNLKGKGFVYVAPQSGPLRPTSRLYAKAAWAACEGCIFKEVLKHEVGHVFGLMHASEGKPEKDIMSEGLPGVISTEKIVQAISREPTRMINAFNRPYFTFDLVNFLIGEVDEDRADIRKTFGMTDQETILKIVNESGDDSGFSFFAAPNAKAPFEKIGTSCVSGTTSSVGMGSESAVSLFLSEDQKVFTKVPSDDIYGIIGGHQKMTSYENSLSFCSTRGADKVPVLFRIGREGQPMLGALINGMIETDLLEDDRNLLY